jgi:hypothetical protein
MMRLARMVSMLAPMAAGGSERFTAPSAQIMGGRYPTTAPCDEALVRLAASPRGPGRSSAPWRKHCDG